MAEGRLCRPEQCKKTGPRKIRFCGPIPWPLSPPPWRSKSGVSARSSSAGLVRGPLLFCCGHGIDRGPISDGARAARTSVFPQEKPWRRGSFAVPSNEKKLGPHKIRFCGPIPWPSSPPPWRSKRPAAFFRSDGIDRGPILQYAAAPPHFKKISHRCTKFGTYPGSSRI